MAELAAAGGEAMFVRADWRTSSRRKRSVAEVVAAYGRIDCLVNSAGLTSRGTLLDTTPELFDQHIAINLKAPFFPMQAAVADMVGRGAPGTVVNIITSSAHGGQPYLAPYVAAKAGLIGLTRNAAHAHRLDRIRINGLNIGWTETEGEDATQRGLPRRRGRLARGGRRAACRWASSARPTRSPTSSSSCCRTEPASSPVR